MLRLLKNHSFIENNNKIYYYTRKHNEDEFLIMLNLEEEKIEFETSFEWSGEIILARQRESEGNNLQNEASLAGGDCFIA